MAADERSANEINASEALTRYVAGTFYALVVVCGLLLVTIVARYLVLGQVMAGLVALALAYLAAIVMIVANYRFLRYKEVETLFAASFRYELSALPRAALPGHELAPNGKSVEAKQPEH